MKDSDYYSTETFKLADVLSRSFIDGFLKAGKFSCSPNDHKSTEDSFVISNNKLSIHLTNETLYSSNAVELHKFKSKSLDESEMKSKKKTCCLSFNVNQLCLIPDFEIDLLQEKLEISKLKEELKDLIKETSANFSWQPNGDEVCQSSIAKYFTDAGHNVKLCKNKFLETPEYGLKFPLITDGEFCFPEISEYIGMVLLGCNIEETDFSSYRIPDESVDIGRGKVIHCKGFIGQKTIQQVINEARRTLDKNSSFPWIAISLILPETSSKLFLVTKDKIHVL